MLSQRLFIEWFPSCRGRSEHGAVVRVTRPAAASRRLPPSRLWQPTNTTGVGTRIALVRSRSYESRPTKRPSEHGCGTKPPGPQHKPTRHRAEYGNALPASARSELQSARLRV